MSSSPSRSLGWLAIIIGFDILIGIILYALSFNIFNRASFLIISTFLLVIGALLQPTLIWMIHHYLYEGSLRLRQFIFIVGILGSLIVLMGLGFDFLNTIVGHNLIILYPLSQTQSIIAVGYAFIGIWLVLLNVQARLDDAWSHRMAWLGIIAGTIMVIGLLAISRIFIPYFALYHVLIPELGELVGNLGWKLLYPIWSIWFGLVFWEHQ